jgi:hypothetical protein
MPFLRRFWSVKQQHQAECVGSQTFDSIPPASIRSNPDRAPKPARFSCRFQVAKTPASLTEKEFHSLLINVTVRLQNEANRVRNACEVDPKRAPNAVKTRLIFFATFGICFECTRFAFRARFGSIWKRKNCFFAAAIQYNKAPIALSIALSLDRLCAVF